MIFWVQAVCKLIFARPFIYISLRLPFARIFESTKFRADRKNFYVVDGLRNVKISTKVWLRKFRPDRKNFYVVDRLRKVQNT